MKKIQSLVKGQDEAGNGEGGGDEAGTGAAAASGDEDSQSN